MDRFKDIKELVTALKRDEKLISEMFTKRKSLEYKYSYALDFVDQEEDRLNYLLQKSVLRDSGGFLELDDVYIDFFEQVLDVNEEMNLSYINENIQSIKSNINYYLNEYNDYRKSNYLKTVKKTVRKIGSITMKNVVDLRRNIENTFKNEPNYKNKKLKLEDLDEKRALVISLISQTVSLLNDSELTFFKTVSDEELNSIVIHLKYTLSECSHNLIEIEKQIIDYLNQIKHQGAFLEKLRKLKYLKDQFLIEGETNLKQKLLEQNEVLFETRIQEPLQLSLDTLHDDNEAFETIKRLAVKHSRFTEEAPNIAEEIALEDLNDLIEEELLINLEEVKNRFVHSHLDLFSFVEKYDFLKEVSFEERVNVFCQIISLYEKDFEIQETYKSTKGVDYALVFRK